VELYLSGFAVLFVLLVYLPALVLLSRTIWRRVPYRWPARLAAVLAVVAGVTGAMFWDVIGTTFAMRKACATEAGLHVYKTVEAEGFYSNRFYKNAVDFGRSPYAYVEGDTERWYRQNGEVKHESIAKSSGRYQLLSLRDEVLPHNMSRWQMVIKDSLTEQILASSVTIRAHPGWLDRVLLAHWGPAVWICPAWAPPNELVEAALIPTTQGEKGSE